MSKTTKVLLILAIVSLVVGFVLNSGIVSVMGIDAFYVVFPVGAVFAGLFLISKLLEKEIAHYDEEHRPEETPHGAREDAGKH